jgi:hypothetical protein
MQGATKNNASTNSPQLQLQLQKATDDILETIKMEPTETFTARPYNP